MLIRSQNKRSLINLDCIDTIYANENNEMKCFNNESESILGRYSAEEKAIKVLDMIEASYACFNSGNRYTNSVFQMPQDNEV